MAEGGKIVKKSGAPQGTKSLTSVVAEKVGAAWETVSPYAKTALHWGFIPAIIVVGMTCTEPKPTIGQLLGPM